MDFSSLVMTFAIACGIIGVVYALMIAVWVNKQDAGNEKMKTDLRRGKGRRVCVPRPRVQDRGHGRGGSVHRACRGSETRDLVSHRVPDRDLRFGSGRLCRHVGYGARQCAYDAGRDEGPSELRLTLSFKGGSVTGIMVVGLGIIGLAGYFAVAKSMAGPEQAFGALIGLGFGCSLMSVFARIAGGIYTKAADVGADLVGKVEKDIPEDDPRNPAVIADNVGDNVGDCAGMAADLYETYTVTLVAAMLLAKSVFGAESPWVAFPLLLGGVSIIASIIGTYFVKLGTSNYIMGALYKGLAVSGILAAIAFFFVSQWFVGQLGADPAATGGFTAMSIFGTALIGLALTGLIVWITEYYTGKEFRPVKTIAKASLTGHGTNVIAGLAMSMEATALPALVIVASIMGAFWLGGGFAGNAS